MFTLTDAKALPVLRQGSNNAHVPLLKALLRSQGNWSGSDSKDFGPKLLEAVRYFQHTHLGPDGKYLTGDGEVGQRTWWALHNPSGPAQASNIIPPAKADKAGDFNRRYGKLSKVRRDFLRQAFAEHAAKVAEVPDGSNQGDGVNKYIKGFGPAPWCALFVSWLFFQVMGRYPLGARQAHVQTGIKLAKAQGRFTAKGSRLPAPGDLLVWAFANGNGHVSVCVAVDQRTGKVNTIGGNEGNRVKLGIRDLNNEPQLSGYIDLFGDSMDADFAPGLLQQGEAESIEDKSSR